MSELKKKLKLAIRYVTVAIALNVFASGIYIIISKDSIEEASVIGILAAMLSVFVIVTLTGTLLVWTIIWAWKEK